MEKPFADFTDAITKFIEGLRIAYPQDSSIFGNDMKPYRDCEIRIKLNENGSGYIHLLGEDSHTIDFRTMDHYRLTNTKKPKHLR